MAAISTDNGWIKAEVNPSQVSDTSATVKLIPMESAIKSWINSNIDGSLRTDTIDGGYGIREARYIKSDIKCKWTILSNMGTFLHAYPNVAGGINQEDYTEYYPDIEEATRTWNSASYTTFGSKTKNTITIWLDVYIGESIFIEYIYGTDAGKTENHYNYVLVHGIEVGLDTWSSSEMDLNIYTRNDASYTSFWLDGDGNLPATGRYIDQHVTTTNVTNWIEQLGVWSSWKHQADYYNKTIVPSQTSPGFTVIVTAPTAEQNITSAWYNACAEACGAARVKGMPDVTDIKYADHIAANHFIRLAQKVTPWSVDIPV